MFEIFIFNVYTGIALLRYKNALPTLKHYIEKITFLGEFEEELLIYLCTKNLDDMVYNSWDVECNRLKLAIMGQFFAFTAPSLPFPFPKNLKNQNFEKMKKIAANTTILHMCTKIWGWDRHNYLSFWPITLVFTPLTARKIKI